MDGVVEELVKVKTEEGLDIFTLTDATGKVIIRANNLEAFGDNQNHNELITAVLSRNAPVAATVIMSVADLRVESPLLAKQAFFKFIDTPMARTRDETEETNGMVLGAAAPIFDLQGHLIVQKDPDLAEHINYALEVDNLHVTGTSKVRHLIEVFINDVGLEEIKSKVSNPLKGLRVAPYYGCQILRPRKDHEDVENPQYFEDLLSTIGAEPIEYSSKARCCGGSLIITNRKAALDMVRILLQDAINHNADVIATTCPMCNVNLEVYQDQVNREFGTQFSIPVMYFTQLMGLAMGIAPRRLGIRKRLVFGASLPALAQSVESK